MSTRYTVYDLLESLVNNTLWKSEQDRTDMAGVVADLRSRNAFGVMATMGVCEHRTTDQRYIHTGPASGYLAEFCVDCGKELK